MCFFTPFYGFICDNLEFPSVKSSKIFTAHPASCEIQILHTKEVGFEKASFSIFCKFLSFPAAKKLVL